MILSDKAIKELSKKHEDSKPVNAGLIEKKVLGLKEDIASTSQEIKNEIVKTCDLILKTIDVNSDIKEEEHRHEWTFTVLRDANGLISSVDAKQMV